MTAPVLERAWTLPATAHAAGVRVIDDAVPDPVALRSHALAQAFQTLSDGAATFHGMAVVTDSPVAALVAQILPGARTTLALFRQSPRDQPEPHFIHCDRSMGDWTAVLYLTPDPPAADGTTFWEDRETGARADDAPDLQTYAAQGARWFDQARWRPWSRVPARFNRLLVFPAPLFHSRAIAENYGAGASARLIHVCFGVCR